eukprot:2527461-Rhodomonas_salina.3
MALGVHSVPGRRLFAIDFAACRCVWRTACAEKALVLYSGAVLGYGSTRFLVLGQEYGATMCLVLNPGMVLSGGYRGGHRAARRRGVPYYHSGVPYRSGVPYYRSGVTYYHSGISIADTARGYNVLRVCYAVSGTDLAHAAICKRCYGASGTELAMSGTDLARRLLPDFRSSPRRTTTGYVLCYAPTDS